MSDPIQSHPSVDRLLPNRSTSSIPESVFKTWVMREKVEWEAQDQFFKIAHWLKSNAPENPKLHSSALQCAQEEVRHAELCRKLLALSPSSVPLLSPDREELMGPKSLSEKQKVLYSATALSCITETLSTALLLEMNRRAETGLFQSVVKEILEDEIGHSKIGWGLLAYFGEFESLSWLSEFIPGMLSASYNLENSVPRKKDLSPWGILGENTVREIFYSSTREVILPGLKLFGISVDPRWEKGLSH